MSMQDMIENRNLSLPHHYAVLDKVEWAIMAEADIYQDILSDAIQDDEVSMGIRIGLFHGKPEEAGRAIERYVTNHLYNHYAKEIEDDWVTYTNFPNSLAVLDNG